MSVEKKLSYLSRPRIVACAITAAVVFALIGCAQTPPPAPAPTAAPDSSIGVPPVPVSPPAVATGSPSPSPSAQSDASTAASPLASAPAPAAAAPLRALDAKTVATAAALTPTGQPRYQCVNGKAPGETRSAIALPPGSERICSRFPAMGPCQYERDACRAKGGRVIRFDDTEITKDVEREYDKQVQRFKLNAG